MKTNKYSHLRYFIFVCLLLSLVILTACKPNAPASKPFPDLKEWDLLIISDSTNWGVGQYYAKLIEADMNVKVNLHDCWVGALSIGSALQALQSGKSLYPELGTVTCQTPWSDHAWIDLIKEAEVMVLFGNPWDSYPPDGSWNIPENPIVSCIYGGYEGKNLLPGFKTSKERMLKSCAPETFATYKTHLGAFLDEIDKIREGRPLILRMTDFYIPLHSSWAKNGIDEVCTTCTSNALEAVQQVAEEHGVPVANTLVALNGEDYMSDPVEEGYIGPDGAHLSDSGAQFVATILQKTGYAYAGK
jgi:hypothetical protein